MDPIHQQGQQDEDEDEDEEEEEELEPIHQAALDGDLDAIDQLLLEDGNRLNRQVQQTIMVDRWDVEGSKLGR